MSTRLPAKGANVATTALVSPCHRGVFTATAGRMTGTNKEKDK